MGESSTQRRQEGATPAENPVNAMSGLIRGSGITTLRWNGPLRMAELAEPHVIPPRDRAGKLLNSPAPPRNQSGRRFSLATFITQPAFQRAGSELVWFWKLGTGDAYWGYSVRAAVVLRTATLRWESLYTYIDQTSHTEVIQTKASDDMQIIFAALRSP
jgi:hypothetical protein